MLYDLFIHLLGFLFRIASLFNAKARLWVAGRRNWRARYRSALLKLAAEKGEQSRILWVHAASLGEFEQGRPLIAAFRTRYPRWRIVLTFFSPSGFEVRKNYAHADLICYLPADTRRNACDFVEIVRPDIAVFVKYEFWSNYLHTLKDRQVPTFLVSALFRPEQPFFRWYGGFWRDMLDCFTQIFVQNTASESLLKAHGVSHVRRAGDTRVDRVLDIAAGAPENALVASFARTPEQPDIFVAGSTWEADESVLLPALSRHFSSGTAAHTWKLIIAPHEPGHAEKTARTVRQVFGFGENDVVFYSKADERTAAAARVLVIDNVGLLNTLYRYGKIAYIGGGFGKGIHNTLEPAAFGLPVLFGPRYEKFEEAQCFVAAGGAFPVRDSEEVSAVLEKLSDREAYARASGAVRRYLEENRGATDRILSFFVQIMPENA
ncbi:MAG: 3-deoxy-D-manno-octulosonic acid transferase [Lewinellaceae bacterium]|nr:3-deoxy-D-manno-octulosonic acid transferase [Lewinellaceae bacterium]